MDPNPYYMIIALIISVILLLSSLGYSVKLYLEERRIKKQIKNSKRKQNGRENL